jgi:predicted amidohydrolase
VGYPDIPNLPPEEDEFRNRADIKPFVETTDGKTSKRFAKLAKELKIYLVTGIAEVEASTDKYFNTLLVFNPKGQLIQTYRKINLFEGELKFLSAGTERKYFETEFGKVGLFTCYDIHFDNPARDLVRLDKVKAISFSTSWVGDNGITTFQSFAKSNGVYFMASNHTYFPDSGVIAPDGVIQSHIRQSSGPAYGYIKIK